MPTAAPNLAAGYSLRGATAGDEEFLHRLYALNHRAEFLPLGLPEAHLQPLLAMQARAQAMTYAKAFPHATSWIVCQTSGPESESEAAAAAPVGRMLYAADAANLRLVDLALLPTAQGQGLGTTLLRQLQAEASLRGLTLRLQVRGDNPAMRLYLRVGFRVLHESALDAEMEWDPSR